MVSVVALMGFWGIVPAGSRNIAPGEGQRRIPPKAESLFMLLRPLSVVHGVMNGM